tara:strand:+ start:275 stop:508 length:234 start_codon:yes stop_codon:yes gene_type:complete
MANQYAAIVAELQSELRELKTEIHHAATSGPWIVFEGLRELQRDFESQIATYQKGGRKAAELLYPNAIEWAESPEGK